MNILVGLLVFAAILGAHVLGYLTLPADQRHQVEPWVKVMTLVLASMFASAAVISTKATVVVVCLGIVSATAVTIGLHKRLRSARR